MVVHVSFFSMRDTVQPVKTPSGDKDLAIDGRKLRWRRRAAGLSVEELATAAGCSKGHISMIENGHRDARTPTLVAIARALGCEISELMPPEPTVNGGTA